MDRASVIAERARRSSIATWLSTDSDGFSPEWGEDPDNLDPINLPEDDSTHAVYHRSVQAAQAQPVVSESASSRSPPIPPRMAPANGTAETLASLVQHLVSAQEEHNLLELTLSQKDAAAMLSAVPPVATNGIVLSGSKLLAWFTEVDTWLDKSYWAAKSPYNFNALQKLFADTPTLLMTYKQVTQSDARVIAHRAGGRWKEAGTLVADAIIATHTGDRHVALRKRLKPGAYLAQLGDMTVADAATAHLEDV